MPEKINELKEKLYSREGPGERKPADELHEVHRSREEKAKTRWEEEGASLPGKILQREEAEAKPKRSKLFIAVMVVSLILLLGAGSFIFYSLYYKKSGVSLELIGKDTVEAGDAEVWVVIVRNEGDIPLIKNELTFAYPKGAIPLAGGATDPSVLHPKILIDSIQPREEKRFEFTARLFGSADEKKIADAGLIYRPENVSSRLTKRASFKTSISRVPFAIAYTVSPEIVGGQAVSFTVDITSSSKATFENMYVRIDYPAGFQFASAEAAPDIEKNIWRLGNISPGETRRITVHGTLAGTPEELKPIIASFGEYNPDTRQWKVYLEGRGETRISSPPLFVRHEVNGGATHTGSFGDNIQFRIFYKNTLGVLLKDVFIRTKISEGLLNMRQLHPQFGFYDGQTHEIVWNAASNPELKEVLPGVEKSVFFSVTTLPTPPVHQPSDKNFVLDVHTRINTRTVPKEYSGIKIEYENTLSIKMKSRLTLSSKSIFYDSPLGPNIGKLPPRSNQETGYTILMQVVNTSSDLKDAKVMFALPGNVRWTGQLAGDKTERVNYNLSSGEASWNIGDLPAGTGVLKPPLLLAFNVVLTPGADSIGQTTILIKDIAITGTDTFAGTDLKAANSDITTSLQQDPKAKNSDWAVGE